MSPQRIVCLTEESVETLFLLGKQDLIVGVSSYVKRPQEATKISKTSVFTHANTKKILDLRPDLVLGFSDIQKDIARELIEKGLNVWISNHRSIDEILSYVATLSRVVDAKEEGLNLITRLQKKIDEAKNFALSLESKPSFYIEEWDEPNITGIQWFSELIELCGGRNLFKDKSQQSMAMDRVINFEDVVDANPDFIFPCWCGKKFDEASFYKRKGADKLSSKVIELEPEIFLQPGPAPIIDGIDIICDMFKDP